MADKGKDASGAVGMPIVTRRHPKYSEYAPAWHFFLRSYLGGEKYVSENLFQYYKEGDREFKQRKKRSYRENHSKRIIDLITSYLFKEEAKRTIKNKQIEQFYNNVDGRGTPMQHKMKYVSAMSSAMGMLYIVVDKEALAEGEQTGTQLDNLKNLPYLYTVYPQDVMDIAFDKAGKVKWALIREYDRDDDDPMSADTVFQVRYRLWQPHKMTLFNEGGNEIDTRDTGIDVAPIIPVVPEEHDDYTGVSLINDVAYLDRAIFNNWSKLDTIVCDQTFSQLIFPIEGLPTDAIVSDKKLQEQFLTLATNRIILYSAKAGNGIAPTYISPDAAQASFILEMIQAQVKQLYASIGLQAETATEMRSQSGLAKSYDFDKLNKLLATRADSLEKTEKDIHEIVCKWMNISDDDFAVEYPDNFDVKTLQDEILLAQELTLLGISDRFNKEVMKSVVMKVLPKLDSKTQKEIFDEIEAHDTMAAPSPTQQPGQPSEQPPQHGKDFMFDAQSAKSVGERVTERITDRGKRPEQVAKRRKEKQAKQKAA